MKHNILIVIVLSLLGVLAGGAPLSNAAPFLNGEPFPNGESFPNGEPFPNGGGMRMAPLALGTNSQAAAKRAGSMKNERQGNA